MKPFYKKLRHKSSEKITDKTIGYCSKTLGQIKNNVVSHMQDSAVVSGSFSPKVIVPLVPRGA